MSTRKPKKTAIERLAAATRSALRWWARGAGGADVTAPRVVSPQMAIDPHAEELEHAEDVAPAIERLIASGFYVIRVGRSAKCRGCSNVRELRFGWCHPCIVRVSTELRIATDVGAALRRPRGQA